MAKKNINITAKELLKRSKLSGRVNEEYQKIINGLIDCADRGAQVTSIDTHISIADAIKRRLIGNGFVVSDGEIRKDEIVRYAVSWTQKDCEAHPIDDQTIDAVCSDLRKAADHYRDKASSTRRDNQCCTSVNGKSVEQTGDPKPQPKKSLPTPPSSTAPATNQPGVTVLKNGKPVNNNTTPQAPKPANNNQPQQNGKKRHRRYNRGNVFNQCAVFEKCTFNVTVTVGDIVVNK